MLRQGYKNIAGLDEAGRGAWAGPIVAAAVILPHEFSLPGLRDSKLLSSGQRAKLFTQIVKQAVGWSVGVISQQVIDKVGISKSNIEAFLQAIKQLPVSPDYLLVDAIKFNHTTPRKFIVRGDQKSVSIAAASIVAKVTRDNLLCQEHVCHPEYHFHKHKGYGTKIHQSMLAKYGVSDYHRKSFSPVKKLIA